MPDTTVHTPKPRIAVIVGSTRPGRLADKAAPWMLKQAAARGDMDLELVDLRDHPLPFFSEVASDRWVPSRSPEARRWQETIARFDGFIFVVAEYNHSITGVLKNALDQAFTEWNHKAFTAIGYGGVGAARAIEHLRGIGAELQMVSTGTAVHIGGGDFMTIFARGEDKPIEAIEAHLLPSVATALDELMWWTRATMAARAADAAQRAAPGQAQAS
jgi:NAD(P)H-dependent FMN reductase